MLKYYLQEALEPTLLFGVICSLLGIVVASFYHKVGFSVAVLLMIGVFFAQMSVNVINDYVDYNRGIDAETTKTRFSGGTNLIVDKLVKPGMVLLLGLGAFAVAAIIGAYFILQDPIVIPLVIVGALSILLYSSYLVNVPFLSEPFTALNFMLIGLGSFIVAGSSTLHLLPAILVALPAGAVMCMALLTNEMPDREADEKHGRQSGAVMLKSNAKSACYYLSLGVVCYASILLGLFLKVIPITEFIAFIPVPLMALCFLGIRKYSNANKFEKYMGINAIHSFLLPCLLILGYAIVIL